MSNFGWYCRSDGKVQERDGKIMGEYNRVDLGVAGRQRSFLGNKKGQGKRGPLPKE